MGMVSAFFIFRFPILRFLLILGGGPIFLEPGEPEPSEPDFETEPLEPELDDFETVRNRTEPELPGLSRIHQNSSNHPPARSCAG